MSRRDTAPSGVRILFRRELHAGRRTVLFWWLPVAGMLALTCALQPSFAGDGGLLAAKIQAMPESMRKAFGVELADFGRPVSYLAVNFLFVTLGGALMAALLGAAVVAKEEVLHTAEILYAQPVGRDQILAGKAAAVAVYAVAFPIGLALVAASILGAVVPAPLEAGLMASLFAGVVALGLCFAGAGMLVAALVRDPRAASGGALGLALGTYFIGVVSAIASPAAPLRWLSPYKLVEPSAIVAHGGLDPVRASVLVGLGLAFGGAAIVCYRRRDIHA